MLLLPSSRRLGSARVYVPGGMRRKEAGSTVGERAGCKLRDGLDQTALAFPPCDSPLKFLLSSRLPSTGQSGARARIFPPHSAFSVIFSVL